MSKLVEAKWIETGYSLLAKKGLEGVKVERLAQTLKLNKSGFYHYFGDPQNFLNVLFDHHKVIAQRMAAETLLCQSLDPDYFLLMVKYKPCLVIQEHLFHHENDELFRTTALEVRQILDEPFFPLWNKFIHLSDDPETSLKYFELFRNVFHFKVSFDTLNYEFLHRIQHDVKIIVDLIQTRRVH